MSNIIEKTVLDIHHWTDTLFTLRLNRDPGFRFDNGQFAMIGLMVDGRPLMRAYSMVSANYEEHLEFLSIKVPNGPLTSRLAAVKPGDTILVNKKTTGTLVLDNLRPGKRVYLLATGTGLAPFLSIIKDPELYERFDQVVLVHSVRHIADLAYRDFITEELPKNEFFGDEARHKLLYYPTVTREPFRNQGRITDLVANGKLFADLGLPALNRAEDRVMICGNPHMMTELIEQLEAQGFDQGSHAGVGDYVIEKAFAEK
ncbi:ferredoxin--NADP reductase [Magnetospirillum moscoviense]|uniref:ferredoxin--NADP(+) reductase n=1 Tax=Magnetospirillum moscoviense TaxID=1437059 RepID=A0A178MLL5_9PROT|nr:ferredoxin--NADP reductase [Magnetospirillum moscoviense]OAN48844.1 ferredoxin--NADP(+) reductase [Magnetospirillum moscoviense]